MKRHLLIPIPVLLLSVMLGACSRDESPAPLDQSPDPVSEWRVSIALPEVTLPVDLHFAANGGEAWFRNGVEKVSVPEVRQEDTGWILRFPTFNNTIVLQETEDGFSGSLTLVKRGYEQHMELVAEPDPGYRFTEYPEPIIDVTGRWEVVFTDEDGKETAAVGEFDQQGGQLAGTFLTATGDYRYLAGDVDGNIMRLSTFDGAHAFVFVATAQEDGTLHGDFWSGTSWHESFVAKRNFDARLPDANTLTHLKEGYDTLEFTFPDLDGNPVSLDDERFSEKVVLVSLGGTWCPNCADEMEFLSGVYGENQGRGLEIISVLYEHFEEFEIAARQGRALVEKHDIGFEVLVGGFSAKEAAAETLPMLNHVMAYPTLIFIDRSGEVRRIHTGFSGPGTGQYYEDFKDEFTLFLDGLLEN